VKAHVMPTPWTVLMGCAGASDTDRPAWLAERRLGVTATEVRDLMVHKVAAPTLVARKLGRKAESDWTGAYAAWGKMREPIIAAEVQTRWAIQPESRLFHAPVESRFMCSPDGVGVNFDEEITGSEIKTSEEDLSPWLPLFSKLGYDLQCQFCMFVTGARRWLFVWEERFGMPGDFWPGERHFYWIERDDAVIARMVTVASGFLAMLDVARDEPWLAAAFDEELDTHAVNYLRFLAEENAAKEAKQIEWAALLAAGKSQESPLARITYRAPATVDVDEVDFEAARATLLGAEMHRQMQAAQAAWDAHCEKFKTTKQVTGRPTLRVTSPKPEGA
jgi:hypothetical protein